MIQRRAPSMTFSANIENEVISDCTTCPEEPSRYRIFVGVEDSRERTLCMTRTGRRLNRTIASPTPIRRYY